MLKRSQIIRHIQAINPTAKADWLSRFDDTALRYYLDHLQKILEPRGSQSFWVRPGETPPVVTRRAAS